MFSELIAVRNKTINFLFLSFLPPPVQSVVVVVVVAVTGVLLHFIRDSLWLAIVAVVAVANTKPMDQSDQTLKLRSDNSD